LVQEGIDVALRMGRLADSASIARSIASGRHAVVGTPTYFARASEPLEPGDLAAREAVIYAQEGGAVWTFRRDGVERAVRVNGRLRVTAAEGVRAAVLANVGFTVVSEWMFTPELADGTVKSVLKDWELPPIDLWAVFPAGRAASSKARAFTNFVEEIMGRPPGGIERPPCQRSH
jgi:DNA-binding transcriptional LysR family regulator